MKKTTFFTKTLCLVIFLISAVCSYAAEKNTIYVYNDEGTSPELVSQTIKTLKTSLPAFYSVRTVDAQTVIQNRWADDAVLFVMPGGADLPYVKKLNGIGNTNIKTFVKNGGSYLGLCAGGYYGSGYVEFDKGGELEVIGTRELAFFPGKAIGPILAKYNYQNNSGSRAAKISLDFEDLKETTLYYNGGGFFEDAQKYPNVSVIGYYQVKGKKLPAIIYVNDAKGKVILSGVHFEFDASAFYTADPYLSIILPDLKQSDPERRALAIKIFNLLNLQTQH